MRTQIEEAGKDEDKKMFSSMANEINMLINLGHEAVMVKMDDRGSECVTPNTVKTLSVLETHQKKLRERQGYLSYF